MLAVLDCSYNRAPTVAGRRGAVGSGWEGMANLFPAVESSLPSSQSLLEVEEERTSVLQASSHPQQVSSPGWLRFTGGGRGEGKGVSASQSSLQHITTELSNTQSVARPRFCSAEN